MLGTLNKDVFRGGSTIKVKKGKRVTVVCWKKIEDDGHCLVRVGKSGRPFDTLQVNVDLDKSGALTDARG